jgi:hypothetical protein
MATNALNGYQYVTGIKETASSFTFADNILSYGDMSLDIKVKIPASSGMIRLGRSYNFGVDLNIGATVNMKF